MSYRITLQADAGQLTGHFGVTQVLAYYERNIERGPTEYITAICAKGKERVLDEFRWGLLPFWARNSVQADGVSILANRSFDYLLRRQRCVIPCSTYYRFVPEQRKRKAERILLHRGSSLPMAGVYDVRISPLGEELRTCTILTTRSSAPGREEDVPMLLGPEQIDAWLSSDHLDKRSIRDLVERIADAQPKSLRYAAGEPVVDAGGDGGLQPFPA